MNDQIAGSGTFGERDGALTFDGDGISTAHPDYSKMETKNRGARHKANPLRWATFSQALKALSGAQREVLFWSALAVGGGVVLLLSTDRAPAVKESRVVPLSLRVPKGKRAYSLELESFMPLSRGDRFDLFGQKETSGAVASIVENILVLEAYPPKQLVVALTADEIAWVEMAKQTGKLKVAVRGPDEGVTGKSMGPYRRRERKRRAPQISIWEE
jgi:hypothetical protein